MEQNLITEIVAVLGRMEGYSLLAAKDMLTLDEACILTGLSKGRLYALTSAHKIPYYKPNGKNLYFAKKELNDWLRRNKVATAEEQAADAAAYDLNRTKTNIINKKG